jgi:hypothetical protein
MPLVMFDEFTELATSWTDARKAPAPHSKAFAADQRSGAPK